MARSLFKIWLVAQAFRCVSIPHTKHTTLGLWSASVARRIYKSFCSCRDQNALGARRISFRSRAAIQCKYRTGPPHGRKRPPHQK
ncbi:hypothetical protein BJY52DRAFT_1245012 [Lactarius psammicola]|nr:hypothetical protein BJY52DRAFT_1245012 [Lactarius psammicola]